MADTFTLRAKDLETFTAALFVTAGVPANDATIVAESLVAANLQGHDSHGVVRVWDYLRQLESGDLIAGAELRTLSETPAMLAVDAGRGFGQVQMRQIIKRVAPKAREMGIACATAMNCGHIGRLAEWMELIAGDGLAGLIAVNDNGVLQCVAPPGGTAPTISTNPIAVGVPTGGDPLVLDISTSTVANGKVKVAYLAGTPCPDGWLLDHEGNPTTDPSVRFKDPRGTILPMGGETDGYKGFGLGLLFDMLVGGLTGGFCPPAPADAPSTNNVLLVLWDPKKFAGTDHFLSEADKLIADVRNVPRKRGVDRIRLPGDRSAAVRAERLQTGIAVEAKTWNKLCEFATEHDVAIPPTAT